MPRLQDTVPGHPRRTWKKRRNPFLLIPLHFTPEFTRWLFDSDLANYLQNEIKDKAFDLVGLTSEFEALPSTDRSASWARQRQIKEWFEKQRAIIDERFGKFLQLRN